jgi:hypothetical protein
MTNEYEIEKQALTIPEQALALQVVDNETYEQAGEMAKDTKRLLEEINKLLDPIISSANKTHKEAVARKKGLTEPLKEVDEIIRSRMTAYTQDQDNKRKAEEERLRAEAKKLAEEEALRKAERAIAQGASQEEAAAMIEVKAAPVVLQDNTPKVKGISSRKNWKFRIVDEDKIPRKYMIPNKEMIGQTVRAEKDRTDIPGIEAYAKDNIAVGS